MADLYTRIEGDPSFIPDKIEITEDLELILMQLEMILFTRQHDVLGEVLTFNGKTAKPIKIEANATPSIPTQATGPSLLDCKTVNCADHQAVISAVRSTWSALRISSC
jgi:hypothetical protein